MEIKRVIEILSDKGLPDLVGGYDFDYDYDEYEEACNTAIQELEKIEKGVVPVDWHNSVYETIQKRYLDLLELTRWIPVTERLPDEDVASVLIYTKEGGVAEGQYYPTINAWKQFRWSVEDSNVTHWMALPEPPQEFE